MESGKFAREDIVVLDDEEMFSSALIFGLRMGGGVDMDILGGALPARRQAKVRKTARISIVGGAY